MRTFVLSFGTAALAFACMIGAPCPAAAQTVTPPSVAPTTSETAVSGGSAAEAAVAQATVKVGDLVRASPGGPVMRVRSVSGDEAICEWQTRKGPRRTATFPIAQLTVVGGREYQEQRTEPQRYRPCPASVITSKGRHECLG